MNWWRIDVGIILAFVAFIGMSVAVVFGLWASDQFSYRVRMWKQRRYRAGKRGKP